MIKIKLKEYLEEKKISINFLHEMTGIRYATIYHIVHQKHSAITLEHIYNIMNALNIKDMNVIFEIVES